jgi:hypothetical protein
VAKSRFFFDPPTCAAEHFGEKILNASFAEFRVCVWHFSDL